MRWEVIAILELLVELHLSREENGGQGEADEDWERL